MSLIDEFTLLFEQDPETTKQMYEGEATLYVFKWSLNYGENPSSLILDS